MKAVAALALVLLLAACARTDGGNDTAMRVQLTYQPFQCVDTPWQSWYRTGGSTLGPNLTDEELINAFYLAQGINLTDVERFDPGRVVCDACEVCPTSYVFRAQVSQSDTGRLRAMGWNSTVT